MVKEIEKSILYVVHNMHFTANRIAIINILYNDQSDGLTFPEITSRMIENKRGKTVSGISSQMAQVIDKLEKPGEKFGFTGYLLFFERYNNDLHKIRSEFRAVIDDHPTLHKAMQISVEQIYHDYPKGLDL